MNKEPALAKGMAPTLDASVNWVPFSDPSSSSNPQKGEVQFALQLCIPVTDGGKTKYETLNAGDLVQAAEAVVRHIEDAAGKELALAQNRWKKATAIERDKKREVERSNEELAITEMMYREGLGAQIDLLNAQTDNQQVRTEHLQAVLELYGAIVDIKRAMGTYTSHAENFCFKK